MFVYKDFTQAVELLCKRPLLHRKCIPFYSRYWDEEGGIRHGDLYTWTNSTTKIRILKNMLWFNFILGFKLVIIHTSPYPKTMGNKIKLGIQLKPNFTAICNCIDYSYSCQGFAILRAFRSFSSIEKRLKTRDTTVLHGS